MTGPRNDGDHLGKKQAVGNHMPLKTPVVSSVPSGGGVAATPSVPLKALSPTPPSDTPASPQRQPIPTPDKVSPVTGPSTGTHQPERKKQGLVSPTSMNPSRLSSSPTVVSQGGGGVPSLPLKTIYSAPCKIQAPVVRQLARGPLMGSESGEI